MARHLHRLSGAGSATHGASGYGNGTAHSGDQEPVPHAISSGHMLRERKARLNATDPLGVHSKRLTHGNRKDSDD